MNSPVLTTPIVYAATFKSDTQGNILYTNQMNMEENDLLPNPNVMVVSSKEDFKYQLLKSGNKLLSHDLLQGKTYYFEDNIPNLIYEFSDENKTHLGKTLYKVSTSFRGRNYILWYEKSDISINPWKFYGIPGIVYEAYSTDGKAKWELTHFSKSDEAFTNPFSEKIEFLSYELYPEKAFGLSEELKKQLSLNPFNTIKEQPRNTLEIKFEWEK